MKSYYLHLGSNLGDRLQNLNQACVILNKRAGLIEDKSTIYETEPWGLKDQGAFLNMVIKLTSSFEPTPLLMLLKSIEQECGVTEKTKWGPRKLDIDILYCDDLIYESDALKIPHPHISERNFVLIPLMEIAGDFIDPVLQLSIEELFENCKDESEVLIFED